MKSVAIIGIGLIGGSLGQALRRTKRYKVIGIARKSTTLRDALRLGAIDRGTTELGSVREADLVVVATPVGSIVPTLRKLIPFLKPNAVVTDVGSVKGSIMLGAAALLKRTSSATFIGSHPLAGSHRTGVRSAQADLFNGSLCVIVPTTKTTASAAVLAMWKAVGARTLVMTAEQHDAALAVTSHLPHLVAHALVRQLRGHKDRNRLLSLLAGSFRDMTRVAAADSDQWVQIFQANQPALRRALAGFRRELDQLDRALKKPALQSLLRESGKFRAPLFHGK